MYALTGDEAKKKKDVYSTIERLTGKWELK